MSNHPMPEQIKKARLDAGLTQTEAEEMVYTSTQWHLYENGAIKMKTAPWELFKLKIKLNEIGMVVDSEMEVLPTPERIKQARIDAGLTQTEAANLIHKSLRVWQNYELGDRGMDKAAWVLFQIKLKYPSNEKET